jgi:hypothetical protein
MALRRRDLVAVVVFVVVAGGASVALVHHLTGARYAVMARPVSVSEGRCVQLVQGHGIPDVGAFCSAALRHDRFALTVRNTGHRFAYVKTCSVEGLDRAGRIIAQGFLATPPTFGPAGPGLGPGGSVTFEYYTLVRVRLPGVVAYRAACDAIDYGRNVPI